MESWGLVLELPGFPYGSAVKNPPANAGDVGSIPGWGRSPGEGNGNSPQYSCLENSMDRGAWQATVYGVELQSMGSQRVGHDSATNTFSFFILTDSLVQTLLGEQMP